MRFEWEPKSPVLSLLTHGTLVFQIENSQRRTTGAAVGLRNWKTVWRTSVSLSKMAALVGASTTQHHRPRFSPVRAVGWFKQQLSTAQASHLSFISLSPRPSCRLTNPGFKSKLAPTKIRALRNFFIARPGCHLLGSREGTLLANPVCKRIQWRASRKTCTHLSLILRWSMSNSVNRRSNQKWILSSQNITHQSTSRSLKEW